MASRMLFFWRGRRSTIGGMAGGARAPRGVGVTGPSPNRRLNTLRGSSSGLTSWPVPMNETLPEPFSKLLATPSWMESNGAEPLSRCPRKMSSDWGAVAVSTFLLPPGWVGSPPGHAHAGEEDAVVLDGLQRRAHLAQREPGLAPLGVPEGGHDPVGDEDRDEVERRRRAGPAGAADHGELQRGAGGDRAGEEASTTVAVLHVRPSAPSQEGLLPHDLEQQPLDVEPALHEQRLQAPDGAGVAPPVLAPPGVAEHLPREAGLGVGAARQQPGQIGRPVEGRLRVGAPGPPSPRPRRSRRSSRPPRRCGRPPRRRSARTRTRPGR